MRVWNLFLVALMLMSVLLVGCVNDDSSRFQKNLNVSDQVYQSQHPVATQTISQKVVQTVTPPTTDAVNPIQKTPDDLTFEKTYASDVAAYIPAMKSGMAAAHNKDPVAANQISNDIEKGYWMSHTGRVGLLKDLNYYKGDEKILSNAEEESMMAIRFFARAAEYQAKGKMDSAIDRLTVAINHKDAAEKGFKSIKIS